MFRHKFPYLLNNNPLAAWFLGNISDFLTVSWKFKENLNSIFRNFKMMIHIIFSTDISYCTWINMEFPTFSKHIFKLFCLLNCWSECWNFCTIFKKMASINISLIAISRFMFSNKLINATTLPLDVSWYVLIKLFYYLS